MDGAAVVRAYVLLALRLDRAVPGVLDAHLGDPGERARVAAEPPPDPAGLAREAERLRAAVRGCELGPQRCAFLDGQLRACRVLAETAGGRRLGFVDEIEACFGVRVGLGEPDRYREAHGVIDSLLPGPGPLRDRVRAFRARDRVPPERLAPSVDALAGALRARTADRLGLPAGEQVRFEVVGSAPWSGFSRRLGSLRSSVSVNASAGHRTAHLPLLVAHEAYPGHHTEYCRTEQRRAAGGGYPERDVLLARTPQSLVAEGAAELGLEVLVGPGWGRWSAGILAASGPDTGPDGGTDRDGSTGGDLAETRERLETVMADLAEVRQDAALLLHARRAPTDEVVAHLQRWLLVDDARARRMLEFVAHPRWRTHTTAYVEGVRLLRPWLAARPATQTVTDRFARLLDEPWTPATLCDGLAPQPAGGR